MAEVIGVRFKEVGKVYYFDPLGNALRVGDMVIVETARGLECGEVALANKTVDDESLDPHRDRKGSEPPCGESSQRKKRAQDLRTENRGARTQNEAGQRGIHL